jgi:hypothetical protein
VTNIQLTNTHPRMTREARTLEAMIGIYCRDHHGTQGEVLCADCADLLSYAGLRLQKCPFQENKTTCAKCPVHCYKPARREQIRVVMLRRPADDVPSPEAGVLPPDGRRAAREAGTCGAEERGGVRPAPGVR